MIRRLNRSFFLFATTLALLLGITFAQQTGSNGVPTGIPEEWLDPTALTFEDIEFAQLEPTRHVLSNGIIVYLLEDPSLPLVEGVTYLDVGSLYDPADQVSLASLTATLLREGGTQDLAPAELDERLEFLAASIEASASTSLTSVSFSSLSDNIDEVLGLYADVLSSPGFDARRLEVARGRTLEAIRRQNDNPVQIAVREFNSRLAAGHPAGYYPTADTVNAISRDDIVSFYETYYKPNISVMAISGDFDTDTMLATLEEVFSDWETGEVSYPDLPEYDPTPEPQVYLAQRDQEQSVIIIGQPSVYAYTPAYNDLSVANEVLGGGGFSSRLFTEIRTRRGLAYATGSQLGQGFEYPGTFLAFGITRTDATTQVLSLILEEIRTMQQETVSPEELEIQRSSIVNSAVFRETSAAAAVQRTARANELLGLEPGYYNRYIERVQDVTVEDVRAIMAQELNPDQMLIMVVGNAEGFDGSLAEFGEVVPIDLE
ncbi:MAG: pitrilysin family protein [Trueperaceae bacterium]|nr:pitrilysin family protein [Trueperaceae bacterium]